MGSTTLSTATIAREVCLRFSNRRCGHHREVSKTSYVTSLTKKTSSRTVLTNSTGTKSLFSNNFGITAHLEVHGVVREDSFRLVPRRKKSHLCHQAVVSNVSFCFHRIAMHPTCAVISNIGSVSMPTFRLIFNVPNSLICRGKISIFLRTVHRSSASFILSYTLRV